jgi:hypothetical protein
MKFTRFVYIVFFLKPCIVQAIGNDELGEINLAAELLQRVSDNAENYAKPNLEAMIVTAQRTASIIRKNSIMTKITVRRC